MGSKSDQQLRCLVCHQLFSRSDHLKRHKLRHTGSRPYCCEFCNGVFTRSDSLRKHYDSCAQRGHNNIPEESRKGRKRHACQPCILAKRRCDANRPCASCVRKDVTCEDLGEERLEEPTSAASQTSDYTFTKLLLTDGIDSFTESFHLPPCNDRILGLMYHIETLNYWENNSMATGIAESPDDLSIFQNDSFSQFAEPPINSYSGSWTSLRSASKSLFSADGIVPQEHLPALQPMTTPEVIRDFHESDLGYCISLSLIESLSAHLPKLNPGNSNHLEILNDLHFLITPARIHKFVGMYFRYWHHNYQLIHLPSFDLKQISLPLLASMTFMGALYSNDGIESSVARRRLDLIENYVFAVEAFGQNQGSNLKDVVEERIIHGKVHFQDFQAGCIVVIMQYWSGDQQSRNRILETRFGEIVARSMGLTSCRHILDDFLHEDLWIHKEMQIRTMNVILLLDCAFSFYQNHPCRISITEMVWDLPCADAIFTAEHPFAHPKFCFSRDCTVRLAFLSLFGDGTSTNPGNVTNSVMESVNHEGKEFAPSVLDMFILIHVLCAFINSSVMTFIQLIRISQSHSSEDVLDQPGSPLVIIHKALDRWYELWIELKNSIQIDEWAHMGFYKNGCNFWLVAQLLVRKDSLEVITKMEGVCDDKLEQIKVLLRDELTG